MGAMAIVGLANITIQVIERHIVRRLEQIFSPVVDAMSDTDFEAIASKPSSAKHQRQFLKDCIKKLQDRHKIFRSIVGSSGKWSDFDEHPLIFLFH